MSIVGAFLTNKFMTKFGKVLVLYPIIALPLLGLFMIHIDISFWQVALGVSLTGLG